MNMKKNVIQTLISLTVIIGICSCTTKENNTKRGGHRKMGKI